MKEHLIIKGMTFIGNQLIKVKLIPDPEYNVETNMSIENLMGSGSLNEVTENVQKLVDQKIELERIIYLGVDEWKTNQYNFASKIILDINPGGK